MEWCPFQRKWLCFPPHCSPTWSCPGLMAGHGTGPCGWPKGHTTPTLQPPSPTHQQLRVRREASPTHASPQRPLWKWRGGGAGGAQLPFHVENTETQATRVVAGDKPHICSHSEPTMPLRLGSRSHFLQDWSVLSHGTPLRSKPGAAVGEGGGAQTAVPAEELASWSTPSQRPQSARGCPGVTVEGEGGAHLSQRNLGPLGSTQRGRCLEGTALGLSSMGSGVWFPKGRAWRNS